MDVRTYRAKTMQEALDMVRRELGPKAAVLQTRDVRTGGLFRLIPGMRRVEITASASVNVPSRMPRRARVGLDLSQASGLDLSRAARALAADGRHARRTGIAKCVSQRIDRTADGSAFDGRRPLPTIAARSRRANCPGYTLFTVFTDLIEAGVGRRLGSAKLVELGSSGCIPAERVGRSNAGKSHALSDDRR